MNEFTPAGDTETLWPGVHDAITSLFSAMAEMRQDPLSTRRQIRPALRDNRKTDVLVILAYLDDDFTIDLIGEILPLSLNHAWQWKSADYWECSLAKKWRKLYLKPHGDN